MGLPRMTLTVERTCCNRQGMGSNQPNVFNHKTEEENISLETHQVGTGKKKIEEKNAASQAVEDSDPPSYGGN